MVSWHRSANARKIARGAQVEQRLAVVQRREPDGCVGALNAHADHPEPVAVAKASAEFDNAGRLSSYYDRVVGVMKSGSNLRG